MLLLSVSPGYNADTIIENADPLTTSLIKRLHQVSSSPPAKAESVQSAQRVMKKWGNLNTYFKHGAKKAIGELAQSAKQLFHQRRTL
jgi:hypothetical protein